MKNEHGLTGPMERFACLLAEGKSQSEAYREAYPASRKWMSDSVHVKASMLAADAKVQRRVSMLQGVLAERSVLKAEDILRETARIALASPAGLVRRTVRDGKESVTFLMPDELPPEVAAAVASFEIDDLGRIKYKFWDKNPSLERAAKILGLFEKDNRQKNSLDAIWAELCAQAKADGSGGMIFRPLPSAALPDDDEAGRDEDED